MRSFTSVFLAGLLVATPLFGADTPDWPRWRGPEAKGTAPLGTPPLTWSETEHVKWKFKTPGFGTSTPIVWGNKIFLLSAIPTGKKAPAATAPPIGARLGGGMRSETPDELYQFVVLCVARDTGKLLWQKVAREEIPHEGHHRDHGFASASPVTDGENLYVSFGSRGIFCFDLEGNLKWEKNLGRMQTRNAFGEGASPALHANTLVINWDHEGEDFIVALDKTTGKELWRQPRDEPTTWSTPLIIEHEGVPQVIVSATNKVRAYELATGKQLWECAGMTANAIPTPVSDFGMLYAISGFRGAALLAIRLGKTGDLTNSDAIAWRVTKATPYVPSPLLSGERLYFYSGNNGTLSCFNAKTGKGLFESQRIADLLGGVYASPVAAAGRVYLVGRDGKTVVIKDSDTLEPLATNKLDDKFDASAAIAGKELFLRGHESLYSIAE
ncbi:MAG: signal peptide protein [Chthoniobacteraceae bacterium]|nr:signal peptide protein [Chthoniobacteraceae bacterium]